MSTQDEHRSASAAAAQAALHTATQLKDTAIQTGGGAATLALAAKASRRLRNREK